jgi:hypothetical protein
VRVYYACSSEPDTIVITRISTAARQISSSQWAEAIIRQMVVSGQLKRSGFQDYYLLDLSVPTSYVHV